MDDVLGHFGAMDVGRIPVVERGNPRRVLGILRRVDIVHSLSQAMADRQKIVHHMDRLQMEGVLRTELKEISISKDDAACGKCLKEIKLPDDCVIVSIQRGKQVVVPRGFTMLLPGDQVIALVAARALDTLTKALHEEEKAPEPSVETKNENNQE